MENPESEDGTRQGIQTTIPTLYLKTEDYLAIQSHIDLNL